jgi:exopolyphosphatase/guanosine-5'-triphosphate,3'-diphosphate pyrophosphatase
MPAACIDIGSNTTRLLVAERSGDGLRELLAQRAFTKLGRELRRNKGKISKDKVREVADVVTTQVRLAHELGATKMRAVATAATRQAKNGDTLLDAIELAAGLPVEVLSEHEEARLGFLGATRLLGESFEGPIAVVDVGGGSTEIAIGTFAEGVEWAHSFEIGSGYVADEFLTSDPPGAGELSAARAAIRRAFDGVALPTATTGVAIGGSASSLRRMVGAVVDHETLERAVRVITRNPSDEVATQFDLDIDRVRVLPAGVMLLEEASDRLGLPLRVGRGGLREGVVLELLSQDKTPKETVKA